MRASAPLGVLVALTAPAPTWALGLGDIDLNSALNQPFSAEIALTATESELNSLRVRLADAGAFDRAGLSRPGFLTDFRFTINTDAAGRSTISVRSNQSVSEPFVTMIIEAAWTGGLSLREYTVFLDPPVMLDNAGLNSAVNAPRSDAPAADTAPISRAPDPVPAPAPRQANPAPQQANPAPQPSGREASYGPIQNSETLWAIAAQLRPAGITQNQMMMAIYQANSEAFGGNINLLRTGMILRIPAAAEVQGMGAGAANAAVQAQYDAWRNQGGAPADTGGRLVLVAPSTDDIIEPAAAAQPAPVTAPPATADDGVVASLQSELTALRSELEESRRLLQLQSDQLAELQRQLAENAAAAPAPAPAAVAPAPVQQELTVPPQPSLMGTVFGWLTSAFTLAIVGLGALAFAALWFVRRRREEESFADITGEWETADTGREAAEDLEPRARQRASARDAVESAMAASAGSQSLRARGGETTPNLGGESFAAPGSADAAPAEKAEDTVSMGALLNLDQADPIAEADFHLAYGLYKQAADLLSLALQEEPERRDLQLKLLEVYFVWDNKDRFLDAAEDLSAQMGSNRDAEWEKVVIMGRQICPDASLFSDTPTLANTAVDLPFAGDGEDGDDLDLAFDETGLQTAAVEVFAVGDPTSAMPAVPGAEASAVEVDIDLTGSMLTAEVDFTEMDAASEDLLAGFDAGADLADDNEDGNTMAVPQAVEADLVDDSGPEYLDDGLDLALGDGGEQPTILDDGPEDSQSTAIINMNDGEALTAAMQVLDNNVTELTEEIDVNDLGIEVAGMDDSMMADTSLTDMLDAGAMDAESEATGMFEAGAGGDDFTLDIDDLSSALTESDTMLSEAIMDSDTLSTARVDPQTLTEVGTKLDLARAYIDMGDSDGARSILEEVIAEGDGTQRDEAQNLIDKLSA